MKMMNFYSPPIEIQSRMTANIVPGITDKHFLELEIKKWLTSQERHRQITGDAYYEGIQSILKRKRTVIGEGGEIKEVDNLPNNRLIDNQYAKMVDQKANYLCGQPITFDTKNSEYGKALSRIFNRKAQRTFRIVAERSLTGGKSWVSPYYTDDGTLAFAMIPAHEVLPFWSDTAHTDLDCAVHFFPVYEYDENGSESIVDKVEVFHAGGIDRFIWKDGTLEFDSDADSGSYITITDPKTKKPLALNWTKIPLVCFKSNHREQPLICRVRCLQDALNLMLSNFVNSMEEDVHNTVLVIHNYDGEDLGEFRRNLATYGAVKVRTVDGSDGAVDTLEIDVNAENYKTVMELLKKAIIENARGYDAKDDRLSGNPNQMNIQSMYSDIDLDANGMETEFQAAFEDLLFFVNAHLANTGAGNFDGEDVTVIFNRDILINETEAIDNCGKSKGVISDETIVKQHPWVDDPEEELARIKSEKEAAAAEVDTYRDAFENSGNGNNQSIQDGGNLNE
jgi:SPP1 family phage portal protein